ncbi:MOSC domain-containing protein [Nocardioides sp. Leaf307]|uniref:MOSC domain-containing protein n=1 Tax=Nocardioides sp. Leaf307 TaxID=1736331 RepID=UPI000AA6F60A|nr:MOSC domain-containing protein [Nocardioides sp. Leaf307]
MTSPDPSPGSPSTAPTAPGSTTSDADATTVPRVTELWVAPERHAPMEPRRCVEVEAGAGVVGDRWHGTRHRHVTLQSADALLEAAEALGSPVPASATRRTVTVSHGVVPTDPGARVSVGGVELEVVRVAAPCALMERSMGPGGAAALRRRGGSVLRALSSGPIAVGDPVEGLLTAPTPSRGAGPARRPGPSTP